VANELKYNIMYVLFLLPLNSYLLEILFSFREEFMIQLIFIATYMQHK